MLPLETVFGIIIYQIAPDTVGQTWSKGRYHMVWNIRLPRALLATMVGADWPLLALAYRPSPEILGRSAPAGSIFWRRKGDPGLAAHGAVHWAFDGAFAGLFGGFSRNPIVLAVSRFADATSADRLILAGVAISFIVMAAANFLIYLGDQRPRTQWCFGCWGDWAWHNGIN